MSAADQKGGTVIKSNRQFKLWEIAQVHPNQHNEFTKQKQNVLDNQSYGIDVTQTT